MSTQTHTQPSRAAKDIHSNSLHKLNVLLVHKPHRLQHFLVLFVVVVFTYKSFEASPKLQVPLVMEEQRREDHREEADFSTLENSEGAAPVRKLKQFSSRV